MVNVFSHSSIIIRHSMMKWRDTILPVICDQDGVLEGKKRRDKVFGHIIQMDEPYCIYISYFLLFIFLRFDNRKIKSTYDGARSVAHKHKQTDVAYHTVLDENGNYYSQDLRKSHFFLLLCAGAAVHDHVVEIQYR